MAETTGEALARHIVQKEKLTWESEFSYVTENIAFNMRDVIRECKKNYWGIFETPTDSNGRDKVWFHLTKQFVDFVVKNIDLDTKDIKFRAKSDKSIGLTSLVRAIMLNKLDESRFGETVDLLLRELAIVGTVVVSTELRESKLKFNFVDLLNFYIDPTASSIAEANAVTERILLTRPEFDRLAKSKSWKNKNIEASINQQRTENQPRGSQIEEVPVYRYRGLAPAKVLGESSDDLVPVEIVCSAVEGTWVFHKATRRKSNFDKGYEEGWYTRVHGRWYGEGVAERLIQYQRAYNENGNIRLNRNRLTQLGLWVFRKGSGITPQTLSRLAANGAIPVGDVNNDIKQLPVQDASASSYKDQEVLYAEAQRSTGAFDSVAGDSMPASTTATNGAIQAQSAQTGFTLIREGFGQFMERLLENQAMPLVLKNVSVGDLIRMHCDEKQLAEIDEMMVYDGLCAQLELINQARFAVDPMQVELMKTQALQSLQLKGKQRFVDLLEVLDVSEFDVDVSITTEDFNAPVLVSNINTMTQTLGALGLIEPVIELTRQAADALGLDATRIKMPPVQPMATAPTDSSQPSPIQQSARTQEPG